MNVVTNISAYSMNCMALTSSGYLSVLFWRNTEKSGGLKRLKSHLVNGWGGEEVMAATVVVQGNTIKNVLPGVVDVPG